MISAETWANILSQFETLPERLGGHIALSLAALVAGTAISLPLGIWASRHRKLEHAALTVASIIQTIPSLALLALMVFAWGTIGWIPALIALILYSVLPTLRNTITGLQGVQPACIEAARGVGMTDRQMLWSVQLPLAAPTILAGVRTASVWVVGLATIAQPVGATSLGNYIFVGLQTLNSISLLFGCVFSALLALVLDGLFLGLEQAARRRSWKVAIGVFGGLAAVAISPILLTLIGPGPDALLASVRRAMPGQQEERPWVIGGKPFTEQYILTSLLQRRLEAAGCQTQLREGLGSTILFEALHSGEVDCYVDYTGTILATIMHQQDSSSPAEALVDVAAFLKSQYGIICVGHLGFDNSYVFAMPAERAKSEGIQSLNDVASRAASMKAGTDVEFFARPEWQRVRQLYGLDFEKKVTMDATLMYGAVVAGQLDVIAAYSTDGRIVANELMILDDPAQALPPYDAILLVSPRLARDPKAMKALRPLVNSISTQAMQRANMQVDVDGRSPQEVAQIVDEQL